MTAQHQQHDDQLDPQTIDAERTDPIGPITLPRRTKVGARALALVGTASVAAMAVHVAVEGYTTHTSIHEPF